VLQLNNELFMTPEALFRCVYSKHGRFHASCTHGEVGWWL
jgi:hypothetical protein